VHEPAVEQKLYWAITAGIAAKVLPPNHLIYSGKELSRRKALDFIAEVVGSLVGEQSVQDVRSLPVRFALHQLLRTRLIIP
jgi:hypothetical protein